MPEVLSLLAANQCGPQRGASGATKREFTGRIRVCIDPQLPLRSDFNAREEHLSFEQKTGKTGEALSAPSVESAVNRGAIPNTFGRRGSGMVRGRRTRLQTKRIYPCRFVSLRGSHT